VTPQELAGAVQYLCVYFERKEPASAQMEAWFDVLEPYPGGAELQRAVRDIAVQEPLFPKNLPRTIMAHLPPPRVRERAPSPCSECRGTGILHARRLDGQGNPAPGADYSFGCGHCGQSPTPALREVTRDELPGLGFAPCD